MSAQRFECFGSGCAVIAEEAPAAVTAAARDKLLEWHRRFSRFLPDSELSLLNADPRATVPVSPLLRRQVQAALRAAELTGGLVDPTLRREIALAGYDAHFDRPSLPLSVALAAAPPRRPASPSPASRRHQIATSRREGTVTRPPGIELDLGGIAKGVFADELAALLAVHGAYAVECAGDIRLGGAARAIHVESPFDGAILHTFERAGGGAATSGIGKRSWLGRDGRPAHHLLDPGTGRPAYTGIVQATALARTAVEAEMLSKAALLSGPARASEWLPYGGLIVLEDGSYTVTEATCAASQVHS